MNSDSLSLLGSKRYRRRSPQSSRRKRDAGYPLDNILFQNPQRAILYQNGQIALDFDITEPACLIASLQYLFSYVPPGLDNWQTAVSDFREHVPDLANKLKELIDQRHETDKAFQKAFADFYQICRTSINPQLSQDAVEEMLIQHILTERIFPHRLQPVGLHTPKYHRTRD